MNVYMAEERHGIYDDADENFLGIADSVKTAKAFCQQFENRHNPSRMLVWRVTKNVLDNDVFTSGTDDDNNDIDFREYTITQHVLNEFNPFFNYWDGLE